MDTGTLPDYVDELGRRTRAARHAVSTPLLVHTLALAVVLGLEIAFRVRLANETRTDWSGSGWASIADDPRELLPLLPLLVYLGLWVAARVRARVTGIGPGHDGSGTMAVVSLVLLLLFPWGTVVFLFLGPAFLLGVGLLVIGGRLREACLVVPGAVLVVVGPMANLGTFENHAGFLGPWPTAVVEAALLLGLAVTTVLVRRRERRVLAAAPAVTA